MARKRISKQVNNSIQEYLTVLKQDCLPINQVWLFGSYAKGTQHQWSDIDLCIISSKFKDPWQAMNYLWSKRIHDDGLTIEPVGFSVKEFKQPSSLIQEIKQNGIQLV
ncbi:MAG: nucleotidyltransferase domain-containing protein [Patescibacteria group bacterium]|jgi:predicted nucleotidyltransferase